MPIKKRGWLVNDCLTCIPNTKTFWHDLLENIEGLEDKIFGYTPFNKLSKKIERELFWHRKPDYIIRNATFFRPIKTKVPQICLLQDFYDEKKFLEEQLPVINSCNTVVINSPYIQEIVKPYLNKLSKTRIEMIPMGVDADFFDPCILEKDEKIASEINKDSILFIGAATIWPKGFDLLMHLVDNTNYNFVFVMKDDFKISHPRIKVYNKIDQSKLKQIMINCRMAVCTSKLETFHLAGIESMLMNLPIATTNTGIYKEFEDNKDETWGVKFDEKNIIERVDYLYNNAEKYSPRKFILEKNLTKNSTMKKWKDLIIDVLGK